MLGKIFTLVGAVLLYICFHFIRVVFGFIQSIIWRLNGIHAAEEKSRTSEKSAHMLDIVWKHKLDVIAGLPSLTEFITSHNAFVHPEYVLQDHITLYTITPTEAVFVECDPQVDVTHSSTHFFFYSAQHIHARRIIRMSMGSFIRLADQLPDQNSTMVFLNNTGRCGSTLFCQMFEQTGHTASLSPFSLVISWRKGEIFRNLPDKDFKKLLSASIRILCKPLNKREVQAYIIKPQAHNMSMASLFAELFPQSKQLFMYRNGVKVANSYYEHVQRFKMGSLIVLLTYIVPKSFYHNFAKQQGIQINSSTGLTFKSLGIYMWADCCAKYLKYREEGIMIGGVRHEDIMASRVDALRAIMAYCGLPEDWAPAPGIRLPLLNGYHAHSTHWKRYPFSLTLGEKSPPILVKTRTFVVRKVTPFSHFKESTLHDDRFWNKLRTFITVVIHFFSYDFPLAFFQLWSH